MSASADALMGIFGMKRAKQKRCKNPSCRSQFTPSKPMQSVCSPLCAHQLVVANRDKLQKKEAVAQRRETLEKLAKLKTRGDWMREAQVAFNAYIRARDNGKPCICCGKPLGGTQVGGGFDAGHYRSVGSAPHLRFDERNCHGQSKQCNRYGAGRAVDYRIGLIARIGLAAVESLESDQSLAKWSINDLKQIKQHYRERLKEIWG